MSQVNPKGGQTRIIESQTQVYNDLLILIISYKIIQSNYMSKPCEFLRHENVAKYRSLHLSVPPFFNNNTGPHDM